MDFQTIITLAVTLLIGLLYYAITARNSKKREALLLQPLQEIAKRSNCKISQYSLWGKSVIGIDEEKQIIFFSRQTPETSISRQINIIDVKQCRVNSLKRSVARGKDSMNVIDRVELVLQNKSDTRETILEFYNSDYDNLTIVHELEFAEKWCNTINNTIPTSLKQE